MFGGAKFPPVPPGAINTMGPMGGMGAMGGMSAMGGMPMGVGFPAAQGFVRPNLLPHPQPLLPTPAPAPAQGKDVLLMIRQGVSKQDRTAVKNALQLAYQLQTPIEAPILDMLKKWLGDDAFNAAMGKAPPKADPVAAKQPETSSKVPKAAPSQPPLVLIREGVAAQNKDAVRSALRMAVAQETQIDAPVLEMLRKWLGEEDEAWNALAVRSGIQVQPKHDEAIANSTGKAPSAASASTLPPKSAPTPKPLAPGLVAPPEPREKDRSDMDGTAPVALQEAKAKAPQVVPPKAKAPAPKAVAQPVIRRGPVLKNAAEPPPPDLDASFDAFLQELDTKEPVEEPDEQEAKRRKVEEPEVASPKENKDKETPKPEASPSASPSPAPKREIKRPAMRKPPEPKITKDEWGRDVATENNDQEKEAWQYLQEARAAAQTSVWGAGNFIDFNNFK